MKKNIIVPVILLLCCFVFSGFLGGKKKSEEPKNVKLQYQQGALARVAMYEMDISYKSQDGMQKKFMKFLIDPLAELDGAQSLADLVKGDALEIGYVDSSGQRIAKKIKLVGTANLEKA